jgi:hypothetical protein
LSTPDVELIKLAGSLGSLAVAVVALVLGLRAEARNQRRFEEQLALSKEISRANARPILATVVEAYEDRKGVTLVNHGPGTAVVTHFEYRRGDQRSTCMADLATLPTSIEWNECPDMGAKFYLPAKESETLLLLTFERLTELGIAKPQAHKLMEMLEAAIDEIEVVVSYEDVFGTVVATNAVMD